MVSFLFRPRLFDIIVARAFQILSKNCNDLYGKGMILVWILGMLAIVSSPLMVTALFSTVYIARNSIWLLRRSPFMIHRNWNCIILCWNLLWSLRFCFTFNMGICTTLCLVNEGGQSFSWHYFMVLHKMSTMLTLYDKSIDSPLFYIIPFSPIPFAFCSDGYFRETYTGCSIKEYTPS